MKGLRDKADLNSGPSSILHLHNADNPSENLPKSGNCSLAQPEVNVDLFSALSPPQPFQGLRDLT